MNLLQLFITILWVGYGILSNYQLEGNFHKEKSVQIQHLLLHILVAPIMLIYRMIRGGFTNRNKL